MGSLSNVVPEEGDFLRSPFFVFDGESSRQKRAKESTENLAEKLEGIGFKVKSEK